MSIVKKILTLSIFFFFLSIGIVVFYSSQFDINAHKHTIAAHLKKELRVDVDIGSIRMIILNGIKLNFFDVSIGDYSGTGKGIHFERIGVTVNILPLFLKKIVVKEVILTKPEFTIDITKDKEFEIYPVFRSKSLTEEDKSQESVKDIYLPFLKKIKIINAQITVNDSINSSVSQKTIFSNLNFVIEKLLLRDSFRYEMSCSISDRNSPTKVDIKGKLNIPSIKKIFSMGNSRVTGDISVKSLHLDHFKKYYSEYIPASIGGSLVDFDFHYSGYLTQHYESLGKIVFRSSTKKKLEPNASILWDIDYDVKSEQDSLTFDKFNLSIGELNINSTLAIKKVSSQDRFFNIRLDLPSTDIADIKKHIPFKMLPEDIANFIKNTVNSGYVKIDSLVFTGTMNQISKIYLPENFGMINGKFYLKDVSLKQVKGFQATDKINGVFLLKNESLSFSKVYFNYGNSKIQKVDGKVSNIITDSNIDAAVSGRLDVRQVIQSLQASSLSNKTRSFFENIKVMKGMADISLKVSGKMDELDIKGSVSPLNVDLKTKDNELFFEDIAGRVNFDSNSIKLVDLITTINTLPLTVNGQIDSYKEKQPDLSFSLSTHVNESSLKQFVYETLDFKGLELSGSAGINLTAKGSVNKIVLAGSVDLTDTELQYSELIRKPKGMKNKITVNGSLNAFYDVVIQKIVVSLNSEKLTTIEGVYRTKKPKIDFAIYTPKINLKNLEKIFVFLDKKKSSLKGEFQADIKLKKSKKTGSKVNIYGSASLKSSGLNITGKPLNISQFDGKLSFNEKKLSIDSVVFKAGKTKINYSAKIANIYKPVLDFTFSSSLLNIDKMVEMLPDKSDHPKMIGKAAIDKAIYKKAEFEKIIGDLVIENDFIEVKSMKFNSYGGYFDIKGEIDTHKKKKSDNLKFRFDTKAKGVIIKQFFSDYLPKVNECIEGKIDFFASLKSSGGSLYNILGNLKGKVDLDINNGTLFRSGFESEEKKRKRKKPYSKDDNEIPFDTIFGKFSVSKGIAGTKDLAMEVKTFRVMSAIGNIDIAEVTIDAKACARKHVVLDSFFLKIPIFGGLLGGKEKSLGLDCYNIDGYLGSPNVKKLGTKSMGEKALDAIKLKMPEIE